MSLDQLVIQELNERGYRYERIDGANDTVKFKFIMTADSEPRSLVYLFDVHERTSLVLIYVFHERKVPLHKAAMVAEMVTRFNYVMKVGTFELDLNDGELRYKVSLPFGNAKRVKPAIHTLLEYALQVPRKHFRCIDQAIARNMTAKQGVDSMQSGGGEADTLRLLLQMIANAN